MPYPFVALVGNINGSFTVLELISETMLSDELITRLNKAINIHKRNLQREVDKEKQRQLQRLIKEEQNAAFQMSLAEDEEKERRRKEKEETIQETRSIKLLILAEAREAVLRSYSDLPPEPDAANKSIRVGIRLLNGSRVERRFAPENTLKLVFDFVSGL